MRRVLVPAALLLLLMPRPGGAEEPKPPAPVLHPNGATASAAVVSPRDPASGLPTGKRMHKPFAFSATDRKLALADGRTFVVSSQTGEVVFGDGLHGKTPEAGDVPKDGLYRLGGGAAGNVEVRGGRVVTPTPVPTRAAARVK
jgi:hypothetical protein